MRLLCRVVAVCVALAGVASAQEAPPPQPTPEEQKKLLEKVDEVQGQLQKALEQANQAVVPEPAPEPSPTPVPEPEPPPVVYPQLDAQTATSESYFPFLAYEVAYRFGDKAQAPLEGFLADVRWLTVVEYGNGAYHLLFSVDKPDLGAPVARQFTFTGSKAAFYALSFDSGSERPFRDIITTSDGKRREWRYSDGASAALAVEPDEVFAFGVPYGDDTKAKVQVFQTGQAGILAFFAQGADDKAHRGRQESNIAVTRPCVVHDGATVYRCDQKPRTLQSFSVQWSLPQYSLHPNGTAFQMVAVGVSALRLGRLRLPVISAGLGLAPRERGGETKEALFVTASGILRVASYEFGRFAMGLQFGLTYDVTNHRTAKTFGLALGF